MPKYEGDSWEGFAGTTLHEKILRAIANELAEANRLKRLEIKGSSNHNNMSEGSREEAMEDQA